MALRSLVFEILSACRATFNCSRPTYGPNTFSFLPTLAAMVSPHPRIKPSCTELKRRQVLLSHCLAMPQLGACASQLSRAISRPVFHYSPPPDPGSEKLLGQGPSPKNCRGTFSNALGACSAISRITGHDDITSGEARGWTLKSLSCSQKTMREGGPPP